jgi:hypothetical protein
MPNTNNQSLSSFGLIRVSITLELIGEHSNATAVAHSRLINGQRIIRIGLCQNHLLVSRALQRTDALTVRFLTALALIEFCQFWANARDGASVCRELRKLAGFAPSENAFGSAFASRLSISETMRTIDALAIFGRSPEHGPHELFSFEAAQRSPSDVTNWRSKNGQTEAVKPVPPKPKSPPVPVLPAATPDPFLSAFYQSAKSLLSAEDIAVLEEMAGGSPNV